MSGSSDASSTKFPRVERGVNTMSGYRRAERELNNNHGIPSEDEDTASETGSLVSDHTRWGQRESRKGSGCPCRFRWINNRGALMVLIWNLLVFSYQYQLVDGILKLIPGYFWWEPWQRMSAYIGLNLSLPMFAYPLAGWLADTKLGRYRVMKSSLWIMWIASILLLIHHLFKYVYTYESLSKEQQNLVTLPLAVMYCINAIGLAGFHANIIPFGIDQMEDGSAEQYSSFVHWYYWTRNFSFGLMLTFILHSVIFSCPNAPSPEQYDLIDMVVLLTEVGLLSLALLSDIKYSRVLVKEPKTLNPLKTVFNVSVFIYRHKQPVGQRSALTYEKGYYSRADLATLPYGGPYEVEDVEAVKTFWRMLVFLALASTACIPIYTVNYGMSYLIGPHLSAKICHISYLVISVSNPLVFIIALPIYELIVYPVIHKYVLPMARRVGVGYLLGLLALLMAIVVSLLGRDSRFTCVFYWSEENIDIREWMIFLPILVSSFAEMLVFIPAYEFICAQSPYNMRGLLIGCFYALQGLSGAIAAILLIVFAEGYSSHKVHKSVFECEFWFNFTALLFTIAGLVVFTVVVRWYKNRERDYIDREYVDERAILEAYYDRPM